MIDEVASRDNSGEPRNGDILSVIENKKLPVIIDRETTNKKPLIPTNGDTTDKKLLVSIDGNIANKKLPTLTNIDNKDKKWLIIKNGNIIDKGLLVTGDKRLLVNNK